MSFFDDRYRIVTDAFSGYEAQYRPWWFPFWIQMTGSRWGTNTHTTAFNAKKFIEAEKSKRKVGQVVWQDDTGFLRNGKNDEPKSPGQAWSDRQG